MFRSPGRHVSPGRGRHVSPGRVKRPAWVLPTTMVLGAALLGGSAVLATSNILTPATAAAATGLDLAGCAIPAKVDVAAAPRISSIVQAAAAEAGKASCTSITVQSAEPSSTAQALIAGHGPQLWIPDSTTWEATVNGQGHVDLVAGPSLASSPLVIAVPGRLDVTTVSWRALLDGSIPAQVADPLTTTSGRLAVIAARAALGGDKATSSTLQAGLLHLSQRAATSDSVLLDTLASDPAGASAFPVEQATLTMFLAAHPATVVNAVVPSDGTARFDYPLLTRGDASTAARRAAGALATALGSDGARRLIRDAGLRPGTGAGAAATTGTAVDTAAYVTLPSPKETTAILDQWASATPAVRMLVVLDTSGSMALDAGTTTRMGLAHQAADLALGDVPDSTEMGLWTFASRVGPGATDYRPVVPIRRLGSMVGSSSQREAISAGFDTAARSIGGDTGLYDTVAAAYRELQRTYDPTKVNTLVVITDGRNDDPDGGLSLTQLVTRITADPATPISVAMVGITQDADAASLRTITQATGGRLYVADQPQKIQSVLVDALAGRNV